MYHSVITTSVYCAARRVEGQGQSVEGDQLQKDACAVTWLVQDGSIFSFVAETKSDAQANFCPVFCIKMIVVIILSMHG